MLTELHSCVLNLQKYRPHTGSAHEALRSSDASILHLTSSYGFGPKHGVPHSVTLPRDSGLLLTIVQLARSCCCKLEVIVGTQVGALCGVHAINTLLQGPYISEVELGQVSYWLQLLTLCIWSLWRAGILISANR